ncbi:MAG: protoheme IX farnesyltransferase [Bacteroidetes bacterium]|nr:MAG: protoheme IX farnesyltransferase [Bacteroidota bacterium]
MEDQPKHKSQSRLKSYLSFTKFRLSFSVIVSALSGYLFVGGRDWLEIIYLLVGGILVTAASNGSNQIWEKDLDKLMKRTQSRPLPQNHMSLSESYAVVIISLLAGLILLYLLNLQTALLGLLSYIMYVFIYTPLKRVTPWAVLIGAIPGAMPPMLGAIAETDQFGMVPGVLFFIQFIWQFPHFWAIAWVVHEDYQAGGFSLLPSRSGRTKASAFQILIYSFALIPFSLLPWVLGWTGLYSLIIATIVSAWFFWYAFRLYLSCETKDAKRLMFASFIYLPIVQFLYVFDKV